MNLRDSGEPLPAAAAALSPVTDLTAKNNAKRDSDPLLHPKAMKIYTTSYTGNHDPRNPLISPVFGDWHGLPPLLIHAGEDEVLREDAIHAEALAKAADVDVQLEIYPHMFHVWQLYLSLPQAVESLDKIAGFLKAHFASPKV